MLISLSADEKISQLSPELESGWSAMLGSNENLRFHYSLCENLKEEASGQEGFPCI